MILGIYLSLFVCHEYSSGYVKNVAILPNGRNAMIISNLDIDKALANFNKKSSKSTKKKANLKITKKLEHEMEKNKKANKYKKEKIENDEETATHLNRKILVGPELKMAKAEVDKD